MSDSQTHPLRPIAEVLHQRWLPATIQENLPRDHHCLTFEISGRVEPESLEKALHRILHANPVLRWHVARPNGTAYIACPNQTSVPLEHLTLSMAVAVEDTLNTWFAAPFVASAKHLCRFLLIHRQKTHSVFAACFHRWIFDASSAALFMKDLKTAFENPVSLESRAPVVFPDTATEMDPMDPSLPACQDFLEQFKAQPDPGSLSPDAKPKEQIPGPPAYLSLSFEEAYLPLLRKRAAQWNTDPSMLFFSAFTYLLHRYSGQQTFIIGTDTSLRLHASQHPLPGPFCDSLHLMLHFKGNESFETWTQSHAQALRTGAQVGPHRQKALLESAYPQRDFATDPLVRCRFSFTDTATESWEIAGLTWKALPGWVRIAKDELALRVFQIGDQYLCRFEYDTARIPAKTLSNFVCHWQQLMRTALENSHQRMDTMDILSYQELAEQLSWTPRYAAISWVSSVHRIFERQVAQHSEAPCLRFKTTTWNYYQVNEKANRLAHFLKQRGASVGSCIGVLVDRGPEMVIALLAILKTGAAYVPLDPETPPSRLAFMIEDTAMLLLLTTGSHPEITASLPLAPLDFRDTLEDASLPTQNLAFHGNGSFPAYVMFTSGTTGQPKGAVISHTNIVRLVTQTNFIDFQKCRVFVQCSSPAFDAATFEIWGAFLNGGLLLCIEKERFLDGQQFGDFLKQESVDAIFLTTGLFNAFSHDHPSMFSRLNSLIVGGEAMAPEFVRKVLQADPPNRFCNCYGPTENTTFSTFQLVDSHLAQNPRIPIGKAISHSSAIVVNSHGMLQPVGIPGELWVGGQGVAIGYWNRPRLTAEKFVPDEYASLPGARAYRTGDKVCYLANGSIDFLGRLDHQIKLRGFRIELEDIQQAIASMPGVRNVLVMLREDIPGDKRIAAYWIPQQPDTPPDLQTLIQHIGKTLSPYMIPSDWICMEEFPLNINGKVDRKALPQPVRNEPPPSHSLQAATPLSARNPIETKLVWLLDQDYGIAIDHVDETPIPQQFRQESTQEFLKKIQETFFVSLDQNTLQATSTVASLSETIFNSLCLSLKENS